MPLRFWDPETEEVVIQQDDGSFTYEDDGQPFPVAHGDTLIAEGGVEMEVDLGEDDEPDEYESPLEASTRAIAEHLQEERFRDDEAEEEVDEAVKNAKRYQDIAERSDWQASKRAFRQQKREVEKATGHSFTREDDRDLLDRFHRGRQEHDDNYTFDDALRGTYPDGLPVQGTVDVVEDELIREGGLTREQAAAHIGRTGEPQNYSMREVSPGRFEVVED